MFQITEDALTSAIFHQSTLETTGSGTMAEARQQARLMLRAPAMLDALRLCVDFLATVPPAEVDESSAAYIAATDILAEIDEPLESWPMDAATPEEWHALRRAWGFVEDD